VVIFGVGLLLGMDPIVAQAFGAGRLGEARRGLVQGVYLALIATPPMVWLQLVLADHVEMLGADPGVASLVGPYLRAMAWSTGPLMVFATFRHYLQAAGRPRAVTWAMASANLINWLGNWLLIRGHFGLPALGVVGSGWSTLAARIYLAAVVAAAAVVLERGRGPVERVSFGLDPKRFARLVRLGLPAALHLTIEVGAFGVATALAGRLGPAALAAHQVVLNVSSVTFMVPLGISAAASVRVGHAVGRGDRTGATAAGWAAIGLGAAAMGIAAVVLLAIPRTIAGAFTDDSATLALATWLLRIAAGFQLFDGLQVSTVGALRGLGDTRTAMVAHFIAHWAIGLPLGAWLAMGLGQGVVGLWVGLSIGLIVSAVVLLAAWSRRVRRPS
jgi:MATE family multidrug resistance protein